MLGTAEAIAVPASNFINSPIFYELSLEKDYFGDDSEKRCYIDLHDSLGCTNEIKKLSRKDSKLIPTIKLKSPLTKKMRLRVRGYTKDEYLNILVDGGLTLKYKTYTIKLQDDALEE